MANKVLVSTEACGLGLGREQLTQLFNKNDIDPTYMMLQEADLSDYDAIVVGTDTIGKQIIDQASNIKVIMKFGVGTDNIDIEYAKLNNIKILNMPGINSEAVAEMALALMLSVCRQIREGDRSLRSHEIKHFLSATMFHKRLGILGTGHIGCLFQELVSGFKMDVYGYDVFQNEQFIKQGGQYLGLEELLKTADFFTVHLPLNDDTHHFLSFNEFKLMKETAIIVNTARGGIVNEDALFFALKERRIAGAGLDVFENESPKNLELLELDTLICTPHIAAYTLETMKNMDRTCVQKLNDSL